MMKASSLKNDVHTVEEVAVVTSTTMAFYDPKQSLPFLSPSLHVLREMASTKNVYYSPVPVPVPVVVADTRFYVVSEGFVPVQFVADFDFAVPALVPAVPADFVAVADFAFVSVAVTAIDPILPILSSTMKICYLTHSAFSYFSSYPPFSYPPPPPFSYLSWLEILYAPS